MTTPLATGLAAVPFRVNACTTSAGVGVGVERLSATISIRIKFSGDKFLPQGLPWFLRLKINFQSGGRAAELTNSLSSSLILYFPLKCLSIRDVVETH